MAKQKKGKAEAAMSDLRAGTGFAIFAAAFFLATFTFKLVEMPNTFDAAFVPRVLGVIVFCCAAAVMFRGWSAWQKCSPEEKAKLKEKEAADKGGIIRCWLVALVLVLAAASLKKLGFILTMPWMMFFLFIIVEQKEKRNYLLYAALSIVSPILIFFVFYYGFSQLLPMGILKPFLSQFL